MSDKTSTPEPQEYRGISSLSIRRPVGTLMITSVIFVLGFFFLSGLPVDLLPRIVYPQVRVSVNYAGVAPEVLEQIVAKPLERGLATTEDLDRMETTISEGWVNVGLFFRYGTDIDFALQDVSKNLDRIRGQLPDDADPPTASKADPSQRPIFSAAFASEERDLVQLRDWVDNTLTPQLLTVNGVAAVGVSGGLVREIQVVLDQERLRSYGLAVSQVTSAIQDANVDMAAGRVTSEEREVVGKTSGKFTSLTEIRDLVLNTPGGGRVPLSEVATVSDTHQEQRLWVRLNGTPAVRLTIQKQPDANTIKVADEVTAKLEALAETKFIPQDIDYRVTQDQATFVRGSVASVRDAAILGALLSMLVVLLFLRSLRKTFIIGVAIPIAILATFMLMGVGDLTLNIMSLGGLALGVGMLVDNSIVMLENIFRHTESGEKSAETAAHDGAAQVKSAVIAGTSTHIAAVVPFLLISGLVSMLFREMILTISFSIFASLVVALSVVPMLAAQMAKITFTSGLEKWRPLVAFDRGLVRLQGLYSRLAARTLRWRRIVLALAAGVLFLAYPLVDDLGSEFLPQVDDGSVSIEANLPPGTPAQETNRVLMELEAMASTMPDVESVFGSAGGGGFGPAASARGSVDVQLVPADERDMSANEWVGEMQRAIDARGFAGARIFVRPPRIRGLRTSTSDSDVAITVQGADLTELKAIADEVISRIQGIPGLQSVQGSTDDASPLLSVRVDAERASYLGLNVAQVGQTVRTAMDGSIATRYTEGSREFDVRVMLPRATFRNPADVGGIALFPGAAGQTPIYLRDVADVTSTLGPTNMLRENQSRVLRITGDVLDDVASVGDVTKQVRARLADMNLPEGYALLFSGEAEAIQENNRQLAIVGLLAVFLVFVVMAVQYDSILNPLVILTAIPMSLVGVVLALWLTDTPLGATVLLGVILLAGIVVNNSILMVEFVEQLREEGVGVMDAVVMAGAERLRPILMTTMTTSLGMLPLALGIGEGTEMMQPLAIAVLGGLSLSTILTLFVVPSAYLVFHSVGDRFAAWVSKDRNLASPEVFPTRSPVAGD